AGAARANARLHLPNICRPLPWAINFRSLCSLINYNLRNFGTHVPLLSCSLKIHHSSPIAPQFPIFREKGCAFEVWTQENFQENA
ncbi:MAG: hypothetical protein IIV41_10295, partial [Akkermansia sp.]|nr:hypothetical protein [Akkermansia sp.]